LGGELFIKMKFDTYFKKLNLTDILIPDFQSLCTLQLAQLTHIPFENLDCLSDLVPSIELPLLLKKMTIGDRGGYCFELNILFMNVLTSLGFKVRPLLARSMWRGNIINSKTHIVLLVEISNKLYLADAGFGGPGLYFPISLEINKEFQQILGTFKVIESHEHGYILQRKSSDLKEWANIYAFNLETVYESDLVMANFYTAKYSESYFRHNLVICLHTSTGRKTLMNKKFNNVDGDNIISLEIETVSDLKKIIKNEFYLDVPEQINFKFLLDFKE
jgi:N-hydroxyarylamine O-acetyltransferase